MNDDKMVKVFQKFISKLPEHEVKQLLDEAAIDYDPRDFDLERGADDKSIESKLNSTGGKPNQSGYSYTAGKPNSGLKTFEMVMPVLFAGTPKGSIEQYKLPKLPFDIDDIYSACVNLSRLTWFDKDEHGYNDVFSYISTLLTSSDMISTYSFKKLLPENEPIEAEFGRLFGLVWWKQNVGRAPQGFIVDAHKGLISDAGVKKINKVATEDLIKLLVYGTAWFKLNKNNDIADYYKMIKDVFNSFEVLLAEREQSKSVQMPLEQKKRPSISIDDVATESTGDNPEVEYYHAYQGKIYKSIINKVPLLPVSFNAIRISTIKDRFEKLKNYLFLFGTDQTDIGGKLLSDEVELSKATQDLLDILKDKPGFEKQYDMLKDAFKDYIDGEKVTIKAKTPSLLPDKLTKYTVTYVFSRNPKYSNMVSVVKQINEKTKELVTVLKDSGITWAPKMQIAWAQNVLLIQWNKPSRSLLGRIKSALAGNSDANDKLAEKVEEIFRFIGRLTTVRALVEGVVEDETFMEAWCEEDLR